MAEIIGSAMERNVASDGSVAFDGAYLLVVAGRRG